LFRNVIKEERGRVMREALNSTSPPDHPALGVSWAEIFFYATWSGKDLPNEAEWEKAARGEKGFEHAWGPDRPVWERSRTVDQIDPVKSFRTDVSLYGVYDLAGNAREWCSDYFSSTTYTEAAAAGPVVRNWKGPRRGKGPNIRVARGGGPNWEAWHRAGLDTQEKQPLMGFRCVLRVNELKKEEAPRGKETKR
jgi:formylglycine-generating enzyme required for sulfatase activity